MVGALALLREQGSRTGLRPAGRIVSMFVTDEESGGILGPFGRRWSRASPTTSPATATRRRSRTPPPAGRRWPATTASSSPCGGARVTWGASSRTKVRSRRRPSCWRGGQGFLPTHGIDEVESRIRAAAAQAWQTARVGFSYAGAVPVVAFDKLHNDAFDGDPDSLATRAGLDRLRPRGASTGRI